MVVQGEAVEEGVVLVFVIADNLCSVGETTRRVVSVVEWELSVSTPIGPKPTAFAFSVLTPKSRTYRLVLAALRKRVCVCSC